MFVNTFVSLKSLANDVWWGVKLLSRVFLNINPLKPTGHVMHQQV